MKTRGFGWVLSILATTVLGCSGASTKADATPSASAVAEGDDEPYDGCPLAMRAEAEALAKSDPSHAVVATGSGLQPLETILAKGAGGFPNATAGDADCIGAVSLAGDNAKDYDALAAQCGTGTGMKEFTKRVSGKLDAQSHPRDAFSFTMLGGYCYRFFVVGDKTLESINVRVQRPNGSLLSLVGAKHRVAILDPKEPWCKKHDREFHFVVEAPGGSSGQYTFGVWARPGK